MKLNNYDEKITSIQELMNLDLGFIDDLAGKDCETEFVVSKQFLINVKSLVRNYCDIAETAKEIVELLNSTQAVQFAAKHEENYFETVDNILKTKSSKSVKENQEIIDNALSKYGIIRKTEVDENGNITWSKTKDNNYYLTKRYDNKWIVCIYKNNGIYDFVLEDIENHITYKTSEVKCAYSVANTELDIVKKIKAEFEADDKVKETLEEKFDKEREEIEKNKIR